MEILIEFIFPEDVEIAILTADDDDGLVPESSFFAEEVGDGGSGFVLE